MQNHRATDMLWKRSTGRVSCKSTQLKRRSMIIIIITIQCAVSSNVPRGSRNGWSAATHFIRQGIALLSWAFQSLPQARAVGFTWKWRVGARLQSRGGRVCVVRQAVDPCTLVSASAARSTASCAITLSSSSSSRYRERASRCDQR